MTISEGAQDSDYWTLHEMYLVLLCGMSWLSLVKPGWEDEAMSLGRWANEFLYHDQLPLDSLLELRAQHPTKDQIVGRNLMKAY